MTTHNSTYLNQTITNPAFAWSAVLSGVLVAAAVGILFSLLGSTIGLALFHPTSNAISTLSIAGVIWIILGGTISMFVGGMITGYLSLASFSRARIYGLVTWSLSILLGLILMVNGAAAVLTGAGQLVSSSISISTQLTSAAIKPVASEVAEKLVDNTALSSIAGQAQKVFAQSLKKAANNKPDATTDEQGIIESVKDFVTNTDEANSDELRTAAVTQITENTNLSSTESGKFLDKWQEKYQDLAEKAQEAARQTSNVLSIVALCALIAMLLGAVATIFGASLGAKFNEKIKHTHK